MRREVEAVTQEQEKMGRGGKEEEEEELLLPFIPKDDSHKIKRLPKSRIDTKRERYILSP